VWKDLASIPHEAGKPTFMCCRQLCDRYGTRVTEFQFVSPCGADPWRGHVHALEPALEQPVDPVARHGHQIAALVFAEEYREWRMVAESVDGRPDARCHCHFGERHRQPAIRQVVDRGRNALTDEGPDEVAD